MTRLRTRTLRTLHRGRGPLWHIAYGCRLGPTHPLLCGLRVYLLSCQTVYTNVNTYVNTFPQKQPAPLRPVAPMRDLCPFGCQPGDCPDEDESVNAPETTPIPPGGEDS